LYFEAACMFILLSLGRLQWNVFSKLYPRTTRTCGRLNGITRRLVLRLTSTRFFLSVMRKSVTLDLTQLVEAGVTPQSHMRMFFN
jgi:hypothetical protein